MTSFERVTPALADCHVRLIQAVTVASNEATSVDDVMERAVGVVCTECSWPVGHVYYRCDDGSEQLVPAPIWHLEDAARYASFRRVSDALCLPVGAGLPGRVAASGRPAWIGDLTADEDLRRSPMAVEAGLVSACAFPVLVATEVVGVLEFFSPVPVDADTRLLEAMAEVGIQVGHVVERTRAAEALVRSEERIRMVIETAGDAFVGMDAAGLITEWNVSAELLFGWSRTDAIGRRLSDTIVPERYRPGHDHGLARYLETGEAAVFGRRLELEALHRDGHELPMELSIWPVRVGSSIGFNAFVHDISEHRQAREATERFQVAFDDAPIGMVLADVTGRFVEANRASSEMLGYSEEELLDMGFVDITPTEDLAAGTRLFDRAAAGEVRTYRDERRYVHADGHLVWVLLNVSAVPSPTGGVAYLIAHLEDISERKAAETELSRQALHDPLTGLANRVLLMDRLAQATRRSERDGTSFALIFVDLDGFKRVNDTLGHDAGDKVLAAVAERLRGSLRPADTAARLGGDEFVVLCEGVDEDETPGLVSRVAAAVRSVRCAFDDGGIVTASVGVVIAGPTAADPPVLLREADAAMYRAKYGGKARSEVVDLRR